MIITYLRRENNVPFGCVVALDERHVGYSLCHPLDTFVKRVGRELAQKRAEVGDFQTILEKKYFKGRDESMPWDIRAWKFMPPKIRNVYGIIRMVKHVLKY